MKTFRIVGMAVLSILLSVGLASCEGEGDSEETIVEKKLVEMVCEDESGEVSEVFTFIYDEDGRLIESSASFDSGSFTRTNKYNWTDDIITVNDEYSLAIKDGLVQNSSDGETYLYNASNRLKEYTSNYSENVLHWEDDKLLSMSFDGANIFFSYGASCGKGYSTLIPYFVTESEDLFIAHPELVGAKTKQLPTKFNDIVITYEFDEEGYVSKVILATGSIMSLTWE